MALFDYLFYRFATWFYRGDGSAGSRAIIAISMMQFALVLPWFLFTICWFVGTSRAQHHQSLIFGAVLLLWVLCGWVNYGRYTNRFDTLSLQWKHDKVTPALLKTVFALITFLSAFYISYKVGDMLPFSKQTGF